jgi:hypothetical protein
VEYELILTRLDVIVGLGVSLFLESLRYRITDALALGASVIGRPRVGHQ